MKTGYAHAKFFDLSTEAASNVAEVLEKFFQSEGVVVVQKLQQITPQKYLVIYVTEADAKMADNRQKDWDAERPLKQGNNPPSSDPAGESEPEPPVRGPSA